MPRHAHVCVCVKERGSENSNVNALGYEPIRERERERERERSGPEEGAYAGCLLDGNYGADNARCVLYAPRDFLASSRIL